MKKQLSIILVIGIVFAANTSFKLQQSDSKFLKKRGFVFVPSGSTAINSQTVSIQSFFLLEAEVSNLAYREFLYDLQKNGKPEDYEKAKVYPENWKLPNAQMDEMVENYHTHEAYNAYPVVNISQEGARMYCKWLEEKFAEQGYQFKVRLPEMAEWQYAAHAGVPDQLYAWEGAELRNKKGAYLANFKTEKAGEDGGYLTAITKSYFPNSYGLYNMSGNVTEWVNDTAMSKGGNWMSDPEFLKIDARQEFGNSTEPSPFIGFRPIITYFAE